LIFFIEAHIDHSLPLFLTIEAKKAMVKFPNVNFGIMPRFKALISIDLAWLDGHILFPGHNVGKLKVVYNGGLLLPGEVLRSPDPSVYKDRLIKFLEYKEISGLNKAWKRRGSSFNRKKPQIKASGFSPQMDKDFRKSSRILLNAYMNFPSRACRAVDKNHMNLSMLILSANSTLAPLMGAERQQALLGSPTRLNRAKPIIIGLFDIYRLPNPVMMKAVLDCRDTVHEVACGNRPSVKEKPELIPKVT
jgi:hypothetical protein